MSTVRLITVLALVGFVAAIVTGAATNLVRYPEHDEFAYFGNALYWSGLHSSNFAFNGESYTPSFAERPPLFWWLLTFLFSSGMNPYEALVISPLFAALNAILVALFAYELSGEITVGLFAGILSGVSGFGASVGAHIQSDAMGSFFAVLAMYSFYEYYFKKRRLFILILGAAMGFGLVARDEDLITLVLIIILWFLFVPKVSHVKRFAYIISVGIVFGIPVLHFGVIGTLQLISNIATPVVLDGWPFILIVGGAIALYAIVRMKRREKELPFLLELGAASFTFFLVMIPFFIDNYILNSVEAYVAGRGILARPISHLMMIPETGGVGASLSESAKILAWSHSLPLLLSIPVLIAGGIGIYYLARSRMKNFVFLFLWTLLNLGFVLGGTNLEDRFLLIAFAPIMIFAGMGLGYVWKKNSFVGLGFAGVTFFLSDIIPRTQISIANLTIVAGYATGSQNWLYRFLPTISLSPPRPILSPMLLADGILSLPFALLVILIGLYLANGRLPIPTIFPRPLTIKPQVPTQIKEIKFVREDDDAIVVTEGIKNKNSWSGTTREDLETVESPKSSGQKIWSFQDHDEDIDWLFGKNEETKS